MDSFENFKNRLEVIKNNLFDDIQAERKIVMNGHGGREWERALRKYDELAIRYDQMKKVLEQLKIAEIEVMS